MRILLAETERRLSVDLRDTLERDRYVVESSFAGDDANERLSSESYDLVIIDTGLREVSGADVLSRFRKKNNVAPVMMLVAQGSNLELGPRCLDLGADDYLTKPLILREFSARVRALLRRPSQRSPMLQCGNLEFNSNSRIFAICGRPLALTPKEHAVLESLMMRMGHTLSKSDIASSLYKLEEEISFDSIEIFVHRLRRKLGACGAGIVTLRGIGYLLRSVDVPQSVHA